MSDAPQAGAAGHAPDLSGNQGQGRGQQSTGQDAAIPASDPANAGEIQGRTLPAAFVAHQFKPGQSGNPKGKPPGVGNLNAELRAAVLSFKRGDQTWLQALLEEALKQPTVNLKLLDKIFATVTPESAGVLVQNNFEGLLARLQAADDEEVGGGDPEFSDAGKKE